jgi:hypothetical protein
MGTIPVLRKSIGQTKTGQNIYRLKNMIWWRGEMVSVSASQQKIVGSNPAKV